MLVGTQNDQAIAPNPVVQALKQQASFARHPSEEDPDDDGAEYERIQKTRSTFRILSTRNTTMGEGDLSAFY